MSQNIFGPGLLGEMAGYLREIPVDDATTDIGRASKRYRRAYIEDLEMTGAVLGPLDMGGFAIKNTKEIVFDENATPSTPTGNSLTLYNDSGGLHYKAASGQTSNIVSGSLEGIQNQIAPLAPAGLRDQWKQPVGSPFNSGYVFYYEAPDLMYSADFTNTTTRYSSDGGVTWGTVTYDTVSSTVGTIYFDGIGLFLSIPVSPDFTSTSVDGINFFSSGVTSPLLPGGINSSWEVLWVERLGLWVMGNPVGSSFIATSVDGINWIQRITPDFDGSINGTHIVDNGSLLVMTGVGGVHCAWSVDAITWQAGSGMSIGCQALTWNKDLQEFVAYSDASDAFRSYDGKTWTFLSAAVTPVTGWLNVIWVSEFQRYYTPLPATPGGVDSLWTSTSAIGPWETTLMDGAGTLSQTYSSVVYAPLYKRFVFNVANGNGPMYSEPRPLDIKPMGRIRAPICLSSYAIKSSIGINTSTSEETIAQADGNTGSLIYEAPQPIGMVICVKAMMNISSVGGDFLTLRIKTQDDTLQTLTIAIPVTVGALLEFDSIITLSESGVVQSASGYAISGGSRVLQQDGGTWDETIGNELDLTGQVTIATSSVTMLSLLINTNFS